MKRTNPLPSPLGCHDTPEILAQEFSRLLLKHLPASLRKKRSIRVLDLFSGDGRLGRKVAEKLLLLGKEVHVTFVEWEAFRNKEFTPPACPYSLIAENAFQFQDKGDKGFDLVVSNPPYLALKEKMSRKLGFTWVTVQGGAYNLYGLGILKALQLCKADGLVGILSPFGWIRGAQGNSLKNQLRTSCSQIRIVALESRKVFKEVTQDIGLQFFRKSLPGNRSTARWSFRFQEGSAILLEQFSHKEPLPFRAEKKVAVGPVVWNQVKPHLSASSAGRYLLLYGGNIGTDGAFCLNPKYADRQYIDKMAVRPENLIHSPVLLLRRIMRGTPGNWKVDSLLVTKGFPVILENHVISISLGTNALENQSFQKEVLDKLGEYYRSSGSPCLSVFAVRKIVAGLGSPKMVNGILQQVG